MPNPARHRGRSLPRGPHALSRDEVERAQRERLLAAMIECVATRGYVQTSVADVLTASKVSRATFYQLFVDKEDCFLAAYRSAANELAQALATSLAVDADKRRPPLQRLAGLLDVYLNALAARPAVARACLVEIHAVGPRANAERQTSIEAFTALVETTLRGKLDRFGTASGQRFVIRLMVHGLVSMATNLIGMGDTARLPTLKEPVLKLAARLIR